MTEPSSAARAAKFEQDQLRDKQINALLLQRAELKNMIDGNEADLKHIGYRFPESPAPEKKYTVAEAIDEIRKGGNEIVLASNHVQRIRDNEELKKKVSLLELANAALIAKVKKLSAEKRNCKTKKK